MTDNETLPDALLRERDRIRDVIRPRYVELGKGPQVNVQFALVHVIDPALSLADEALKEHDAAKMVKALTALREIAD